MAGQSKWANIQYRKSYHDAKRAKIFTKIIREITISARKGGGDAACEPRLRSALDKVVVNRMDNILEEVSDEGYGPGGIAVLVKCMTDNRNRTVSDAPHAFTRNGGHLGTDGSVAYLFQKKGVINVPTGSNEDKLMDIAIEVGTDDVVSLYGGGFEILTQPDVLQSVLKQIHAAQVEITNSEITMYALTYTEVEPDDAVSLLKLLDVLEDLDDVQHVYRNAEFPSAILERVDG